MVSQPAEEPARCSDPVLVEKYLSLLEFIKTNDGYDVLDSDKVCIFKLQNKIEGEQLLLHSTQGQVVVLMPWTVASEEYQWHALHDSDGFCIEWFSVSKIGAHLLRVSFNSGATDVMMQGSWWEKNFTICKGSEIIARMIPLGTEDKFGVEVFSNTDPAFVVALVSIARGMEGHNPTAVQQSNAPVLVGQQVMANAPLVGPRRNLEAITLMFKKLESEAFTVWSDEMVDGIKPRNPIFFIKPCDTALHRQRVIVNADGRSVATLRSQNMTCHARWDAYAGASTEDEDKIFSSSNVDMIPTGTHIKVSLT